MKTAYQHTKKGQSCFLRAGLLMLLVLFFCSVSGWAAKQESIKKKEINKSFNVGKNDILQVDNRYGNITVTHWSKSEVSIRVVIEAKARNDEKAQAIIDRVNIRMEKDGQYGFGRYKPEVAKREWRSNESFTINYYVNMPSELTCDLTQKYGNIIMPENNKGKCDLHVKYGNLNGGNFTGPSQHRRCNMAIWMISPMSTTPLWTWPIAANPLSQRLATEYRQQSTPTSVSCPEDEH